MRVVQHHAAVPRAQPLRFVRERLVIGPEVLLLAALDLARHRARWPRWYSGSPSKVVSGHKPVVACPGYSDAPDGSRFTSITVRDIAVRTVVAPMSCAKS